MKELNIYLDYIKQFQNYGYFPVIFMRIIYSRAIIYLRQEMSICVDGHSLSVMDSCYHLNQDKAWSSSSALTIAVHVKDQLIAIRLCSSLITDRILFLFLKINRVNRKVTNQTTNHYPMFLHYNILTACQ